MASTSLSSPAEPAAGFNASSSVAAAVSSDSGASPWFPWRGREKALANRKLARQDGDPQAEQRRTEGIPTFAEAAARLLEQKQAGWRNRKYARERLSSLRRVAFPRIGKVPVSEVTSAHVLENLTPIWHRKEETARRVRLRMRAVLEWAVAMEYRIDFRALCDKLIDINNLHFPLRYRSPHYTHRFESDFDGPSWP